MKTAAFAVLLALLLSPALMANTLTGKDAPAFDAKGSINLPETTTFEQAKGDVVLIKFWGIN